MTTGHVHEEPPAGHVDPYRDPLGERSELVVGDGQEHDLGAFDDLLDTEHGHAGQEVRGAVPRDIGDGVHAGDRVSLGAQGGTEDGADATRADDPDAEPGGHAARTHGSDLVPSIGPVVRAGDRSGSGGDACATVSRERACASGSSGDACASRPPPDGATSIGRGQAALSR